MTGAASLPYPTGAPSAPTHGAAAVTMPRVLLFYSRTGAGHYRVAQTLAAELVRLDPRLHVTMHDGLVQTALGLRTDPSATYLLLSTRLLPAFNLFYRLTDRRSGIEALRALIRAVWGRSFRRVLEREQPDVIVSTHHFMSPSTVRPLPRPAPFVTVVTDIGKPHRLWFDPGARAIVVPHPEMIDYASPALRTWNGRVGSQPELLCFGFPVDEKFRRVTPAPHPTHRILVMGGGSGAGGMAAQVEVLARAFPRHQIVAICGWNEALRRRLAALPYSNVQVLGFVDNPQDYLAGCDLVVTKAGPSTILEAAALGRPLIITRWVGLQERANVDFVVQRQLGLYCPRLDDLPQAVLAIYRAYASFAFRAPPDLHTGAARIAAFVARLASQASNASSARAPELD